jgi:flagellar basal body P-ring protein FlgI
MITMPRGSRKSIEEQIADVETKIQELQAKKKELLQVKEQEDIRRLLDAVKEAGTTPEELVKQLLSQDKNQ